jgi:hypothetical protein
MTGIEERQDWQLAAMNSPSLGKFNARRLSVNYAAKAASRHVSQCSKKLLNLRTVFHDYKPTYSSHSLAPPLRGDCGGREPGEDVEALPRWDLVIQPPPNYPDRQRTTW